MSGRIARGAASTARRSSVANIASPFGSNDPPDDGERTRHSFAVAKSGAFHLRSIGFSGRVVAAKQMTLPGPVPDVQPALIRRVVSFLGPVSQATPFTLGDATAHQAFTVAAKSTFGCRPPVERASKRPSNKHTDVPPLHGLRNVNRPGASSNTRRTGV